MTDDEKALKHYTLKIKRRIKAGDTWDQIAGHYISQVLGRYAIKYGRFDSEAIRLIHEVIDEFVPWVFSEEKGRITDWGVGMMLSLVHNLDYEKQITGSRTGPTLKIRYFVKYVENDAERYERLAKLSRNTRGIDFSDLRI